MTHPSTFDGLLGLVTLHPLLTVGPVLLLGLAATIASRRPRRRP